MKKTCILYTKIVFFTFGCDILKQVSMLALK